MTMTAQWGVELIKRYGRYCCWYSYKYMGGYRPGHANNQYHYSDVMIGTMASQITSLTIIYSAVYSGAYQRKHQSSAPLAFVRGIHWCPVNSPHKWPVTWKMFPFDDVIMFIWSLIMSESAINHNTSQELCARVAFYSQIAKFMRPTWGPPGSCRPQMGPTLAPWILLSRLCYAVFGTKRFTQSPPWLLYLHWDNHTNAQWPLLLTWFNFNPTWFNSNPSISNYIHHKIWDEIIHQFLNFNGSTVEV